MIPLTLGNAAFQNARSHVSELQALDAWTNLLLAARLDELRASGATLMPAEAQALTLENVIALQRFDHRLRLLAEALPRAENEVEMLEDEAPKDVATELAGTIQYVLIEHVRPAIEYLAEASRLTDEDLRRRFRRQQAKYEEWEKASQRRAEEPEPEPSTGTASGS